jgi:hypothetical protein
MEFCTIWSWLKDVLSPLMKPELLSAFLGAIVGGLFTMWATSRSHQLAARAQRKAEDLLLYDTTKLIQAEISTGLAIYMEEYGAELLREPGGTPYIVVFPIGENPFPIYDSSPACLSRLPSELSTLLVRLYMRAKGIARMIELNNSDAEHARELATEKLKARALELSESYDSDATKRLNELYIQDAYHNAVIIGMSSTADAMRSLTLEIQDLLSQVNAQIDRLPKPKGR